MEGEDVTLESSTKGRGVRYAPELGPASETLDDFFAADLRE